MSLKHDPRPLLVLLEDNKKKLIQERSDLAYHARAVAELHAQSERAVALYQLKEAIGQTKSGRLHPEAKIEKGVGFDNSPLYTLKVLDWPSSKINIKAHAAKRSDHLYISCSAMVAKRGPITHLRVKRPLNVDICLELHHHIEQMLRKWEKGNSYLPSANSTDTALHREYSLVLKRLDNLIASCSIVRARLEAQVALLDDPSLSAQIGKISHKMITQKPLHVRRPEVVIGPFRAFYFSHQNQVWWSYNNFPIWRVTIKENPGQDILLKLKRWRPGPKVVPR